MESLWNNRASESKDAVLWLALNIGKAPTATATSGITCGLASRTSKGTPHDYPELSKHVHKTRLGPGKGLSLLRTQ